MRILIAIDDSPYSALVVDSIISRSWPAGSIFKIVTVLEPLDPSSGKEIYKEFSDTLAAISRRRKSAALKNCKKVCERIESAVKGAQVECAILEGAPRKEIVNLAVEWCADRIMMGAHSSDVCPHNLLGSVSRGVANHAPCTVEIIRSAAQRKKNSGGTAACGSAEKPNHLSTSQA